MKTFRDLKLKDKVYLVDNKNFIRPRWIEGLSIPKLRDGNLRLQLLGNDNPIDVPPEGTSTTFGYKKQIGDVDEEEVVLHLFSSYEVAQEYKETQKEKVISMFNDRALSIFRKLKRMEGLDKTRKRLENLLLITEDMENK